RLVIPAAVQNGGDVFFAGLAQQRHDVALVPPQVRGLAEVAVIGQGEAEHDPVDAAGGGAADDIDHDVGIGYSLDQVVDTGSVRLAAGGPEQLLGDPVFIDSERDSTVQHDAEPRFQGPGHRTSSFEL